MEDYNKSRSHGNNQIVQMESGGARPYDLRLYSVNSYAAETQKGPKDLKLKKGKSNSRSSISKSWSFSDPEFQRKKRVASYKMYSVEGNMRGSWQKSFRWIKNRYWKVVYGWW
ncbi:uncharacterized protein LOC130720947 [Lotus japonicus]|uniref:uncharacterized protein LOC130720947 n=1 Tax=Lotus japonicus TaxID=34305 RepID=UPI0025842524|nr:uncharacterized protein LOC130720947 [Lotus japonicus]